MDSRETAGEGEIGLNVNSTKIRRTNSEACRVNGKGGINVKEDSNMKENKGRFGQAMDVIIRPARTSWDALVGQRP